MQKSILITGANSGFGLEIAKLFARNGYRVFAGVRKTSDRQVLRALAGDVTVIGMDVADDRSVARGFRDILARTDRLDIAVNNAGFGIIGPVEDFSIAEMKAQFETNFFGAMRVVKNAVPVMRRQGSGLIVNMSSINGLVSFPLYGLYSATKFSLETVSEALRFELAPFGIRVVLVEPGAFVTNFSSNRRHPERTGTDGSPYRKMTEVMFRRLNAYRDGKWGKGGDPARVAQLVWRISRNPHPKLRYAVGADARVLSFLDRVVPKTVKFRALEKVYAWR